MKQNLHIHSTYVDGKDTPEEMIIKAIETGFDSIGFSEHSYVKYSTFPNKLTLEKMKKYQTEIRFLKEKYKGTIDVFCGLEYELFSDISADGFDYIIGSVHYLDIGGNVVTFDRGLQETTDYINKYFCGNGLLFAKKYFETVASMPQKIKADIVGHFDLITKNNEKGNFIDVTSKEYLNLGFEAINALKGKVPFFEINTGAISRGYRMSPYPQMEFLKEFNRQGFGVVFTSDCHDKTHIDCFFEQAKKIAIEAGFKTKWILTYDVFKETKI